MNGRVLSEEELKMIDAIDRRSLSGRWSSHVKNLIATIRERDKTIAALESRVQNWQHEVWDYKHTNAILREALRTVRVSLGDFQEPWNPREREIDKVAREALAKVKER